MIARITERTIQILKKSRTEISSTESFDTNPSFLSKKRDPTVQNLIRRKFRGVARVCRTEGCTVRDGVDIDASNPIFSLLCGDVVHFDRMALCPAADDDCVPVERLHVTFSLIDGSTYDGWVSLRGRFRDDNGFMLEVLSEPTTKEVSAESPPVPIPVLNRLAPVVVQPVVVQPVVVKLSVVQPVVVQPVVVQSAMVPAATCVPVDSTTNEIVKLQSLTECPLCMFQFPTFTGFTHVHKKRHMDKCIADSLA